MYLLAHNFVQHRVSGPKLYALADVAMILKNDGASLDPDLLVSLADAAGFSGPVTLGLEWSKALFDAAVPPGVMERLAARGGSGFKPLILDTRPARNRIRPPLGSFEIKCPPAKCSNCSGRGCSRAGATCGTATGLRPLAADSALSAPLERAGERVLRALTLRLKEGQREEQAKREGRAKST